MPISTRSSENGAEDGKWRFFPQEWYMLPAEAVTGERGDVARKGRCRSDCGFVDRNIPGRLQTDGSFNNVADAHPRRAAAEGELGRFEHSTHERRNHALP